MSGTNKKQKPMKRLFLFFVMCAFAFVAQAQVRTFHYIDGVYWVKVDLNKKEFLPDGCGVDPMPIKKLQEGRQQGIVYHLWRWLQHTSASQLPCLRFMNAMFMLHECHVYNIQMMMFWLCKHALQRIKNVKTRAFLPWFCINIQNGRTIANKTFFFHNAQNYS